MSDRTATGTVAVLVAFNRRDLLAEALDALLGQTLPLAGIVVVDNASSDDSSAVARAHAPDAVVVRLERNTGGAGGFAVGMQQALDVFDPEWLWLMDDDTIPTHEAHAALRAAVDGSPISIAGSRVVWHDGSDHPMNTPRRRPFATSAQRRVAQAAGGMPVRSSSFVSMLVRAADVRTDGLPIADYFIWNDDFEFSTRLLRRRDGVFVPSSVVVHKTAKLGSTDVDPGERFYFEVRNKLWMLRFARGLSAGEKVMYGSSTALRWLRTALRSSDRTTLARAFRRGWGDGWRTAPRPNAQSLEGLGDVTEAISRAESSAAGRAGRRDG
jgi:rhamnopyranosyl-N-acetylglucosaminyl-diphospho-decaprenol beta-1,3/1,4-galactofuranosyltransferase